MLVGIQGFGKSKLARSMEEKGVVVASNDRFGGKEKTLRVVEKSLSEGKSVVVDNFMWTERQEGSTLLWVLSSE